MAEEFFQYVYEHYCKIDVEEKMLIDIEKDVQKCLRVILDHISRDNPYVIVKDILPTGSFYEGTIIQKPNEFNYTIVIDTSVFAKTLEVESKCNSGPWFGQLTCSDIHTDYNSFVANALGIKPPTAVEKIFWEKVERLIANNPIKVDTKYGKIETLSEIDTKFKTRTHHKLFLQYTSGESFKFNDQSTNTFRIGVDLMLAFEHPSVDYIAKHFPSNSEFKELLSRKSCHLITKSCHEFYLVPEPGLTSKVRTRCTCWSVSFAVMEAEMMRELDDGHKKCYMIMKALMVGEANYFGKCLNLSSYMLKTAMLYHVNNSSATSLKSCIGEILDYLQTGFETVSMPSFFARDMNVWGKAVSAPFFTFLEEYIHEEKDVNSMLWMEFWRRYVKIFKDILVNSSIESFNNEQKTMIDKCLYFKNIVNKMMHECLDSKLNKSPILKLDSAQSSYAINKFGIFEHIPTEPVKKHFHRYINEWTQENNFKDIDLKLFVSMMLDEYD